MRVYQVKLDSVDDAKTFVNIVGKYGYDIQLERKGYRVDAKSIMGVLSLGFGKPLTLTADTENALALKRDIKKYLL